MSPGENEGLESGSPHSEKFPEGQEGLRISLDDSSSTDAYSNHAQSPVISSNSSENEFQESVKSLTEKLSAALLNISAKEELVKQHSRVAEEAILGWEKAESEVAALKKQLETTNQKNSALEDKISHLDGALKECVRQLRQARDNQEQKVHDTVTKKTQELESNKSQLENQVTDLKKQLEASKFDTETILTDSNSKIEAIEKENAALRAKLFAQSEELKVRTLERELSTQTAETASKQHLESIKKVAKLETECRKLRAIVKKTSYVNDHKSISSSACAESLTDSQSDNELGCSDSWASALIAELDQFKNEKASARVLTKSIDIDLMDDFLEMERLASMPEYDRESSNFDIESAPNKVTEKESSSKVEDEVGKQKTAGLEEKVKKLEIALAESKKQLEISCSQLNVAEEKLVQLQKELELTKESKEAALIEVVSLDAKRKVLESQLELKAEESGLSSELKAKLEASETTRETIETHLHLANTELEKLHKKIGLLESKIEEEKERSAEFVAKIEAMEAIKKARESQLISADFEVRELQKKVNVLEKRTEDDNLSSTEFAAKVQALEVERKELEYKLELALSEAKQLSDKVAFLEEEVDNQRALCNQFSAKCKNLEDEISSMRKEAELRVASCSNGDLTVKQEKELAVAAEKLAECQKTIASLGQQLKSLTILDSSMFEPEKSEINGGAPNYTKMTNSSDPLGHTGSYPVSIGRLLSGSRGRNHTEN
ncbi:uncharacterized protein A4U43_C09F9840 [Asparagus officinalis]|uniref:Filament-like plant protein n=1 Tax=Asparagus officinalis TaxID=4686 RepID=A0A5P1E9P1_ASPOF|nr:filament-like plant protein 1 [Asparagus officinalis]XP_020245778.1 filament-like plant protein 1 [Asparagus officinalis]XP_020245779.1 filament-like plant protein 1 [Asparagus officinalis]XP_020245780.1 filament-like plant protein 1 [Asparagus officinalis]XP_020245781.1 filament-like plant protein 1 [Asparagus officinalis]ONK58225.1 uncharacterized protein A4U43_C09F9840 [Asparagus officinalis]